MGWVRRSHECVKPKEFRITDMWRCDVCHQLWEAQRGWYSNQVTWFEATRWKSWRHSRRG